MLRFGKIAWFAAPSFSLRGKHEENAFLCRLALLPLIGIIACQPQGPHYSPRVATQHADEVLPEIDFSDQIIYLVMIDRFANGDTSNDRGNTPASHCLYQPRINGSEALENSTSGDLRGVIDRLV
jgi:hypothetical protein